MMLHTLALAQTMANAARTSLPDVGIILTQDDVPGYVDAGHDAVLLSPPAVTYDTDHQAHAVWLALVIAGTTDRLAAWQRLETIASGLEIPWGVPDEVAPAEWIDLHGRPWPALTITLTTYHDTD